MPDHLILGSEYILFVEDMNPDDGVGEVYLLPANGDDRYSSYEPLYYQTDPGPVTDSSVAGYRFVTDGGNYYVDMYVSLAALGMPSASGLGLWWATDQGNPNLEQGPTTDFADSADAPFDIWSYTIVKTVTDVAGGGASGHVDAAGDVITYSVSVTNTGMENLTGITLADSLVAAVGSPVESMTGDGVLEVVETWTWNYSYTVRQADIDYNGGGDGDIDNTATIDCDQLGPRSDGKAVLIEGAGVPDGGTRHALAFASIYIGIGVALAAGIVAYLVNRRLAKQ